MSNHIAGESHAAMKPRSDQDAPGFYRRYQVLELTTLSNTTLWRLIRQGKFPPSIKLSRSRVGWPRSAVNRWILEKMEAADAGVAQK